jgi:DNA replication licensing factor MCM3
MAFPTKVRKIHVSLTGNFAANHVTPRGLKANLVNQFVSVQGIVTRMAIVKPKIQSSVHYCEATKKGLIKHYNDDTNLAAQSEDAINQNQANLQFPVADKDNNPLSAEYGYCVYKDS